MLFLMFAGGVVGAVAGYVAMLLATEKKNLAGPVVGFLFCFALVGLALLRSHGI